ncbi:MAG TPA: LysR family transcriptional regulator [Pseudomonas sp.]|jgi:DNA-binding transcriptional LysR family regulator|nr:LysR family transcriptional regulator [Pseudomonas sp.]
MRIEDLKLFMLVAKLGSFTAAADALNLPRSNISRRINDLESALQGKLFTRTTRRLTLTPIGQGYLTSLQEIIPGLEHANDSIRTQNQNPTGKIKIGLLTESDILIHWVLQDFLTRYPNISIETHLSNLGYYDIMNYGLDMAIHVGPISDTSFIARPIASFIRKLYASPDYIAHYGAPRSLEDLHQHKLIMLRWPSGQLENLWRFKQAEISIESQLISNNSNYIRHAVFQGAGIALLPEIIAHKHVANGELVEVLPAYEMQLENIWLVYPSRTGQSFASRLLTEYLLEQIPMIK